MRVCALLVIAACAHPHAAAPAFDRDDDDIPDDVDRCPDLPTGCFVGDGDNDGCPDEPIPLRVRLPLRADDRAKLDAIARSTPALRDGALVIVAAPSLPNEPPGPALERAVAVALRLEDDGVPLARLVARAAPAELAPGYNVDISCSTAPSASR